MVSLKKNTFQCLHFASNTAILSIQNEQTWKPPQPLCISSHTYYNVRDLSRNVRHLLRTNAWLADLPKTYSANRSTHPAGLDFRYIDTLPWEMFLDNSHEAVSSHSFKWTFNISLISTPSSLERFLIWSKYILKIWKLIFRFLTVWGVTIPDAGSKFRFHNLGKSCWDENRRQSCISAYCGRNCGVERLPDCMGLFWYNNNCALWRRSFSVWKGFN